MKKMIKNDQGFTLVELMVVVAIIGILSAVAIPNFKRYQAKTKTSEAKLNLSAIYQTEVSLQSDYDYYGTCLDDAGYAGPTAGNYYSVGFDSNNTTANGNIRTNGGSCSDSGNQYYNLANKSVGNRTVALTDLTSSPVTATVDDGGASFTAEAVGMISAGEQLDVWSINQDKALSHAQQGY